jgi:hypothetical protein
MAASGTLIEMTAERCRAAVLDGPQHLELLPAQMPLGSPDEAVARGTDDVGHLQGGGFISFSSAGLASAQTLDRRERGSWKTLGGVGAALRRS